MPLKPIKHKNGYRIDFEHNGVRYRKQGFLTYANALDSIEKILAGEKVIHLENKISDYIEKYLHWSKYVKHKSPKTIRSDTQRLSVFRDWTESVRIIFLKEITINQLREFQSYYFENAPFTKKPNHRNKPGNPKATWEKYRQVISAFLNWCLDRNLIANNPLSRSDEFIVKTQKELPKIFKPEELEILFEYFDSLSIHISAFFRLLAYTGIRLSEAINLKWADVDFNNQTLYIHQTKNYEPRLLPISSKLLPYLKSLPIRSTYIFDDGNGNYLYHPSYWWKILHEATNACKILPRKIHSFRHTFGSSLAENDANLKTIKDLMGHKSIETTLIYLQFCKEKKKQVIENLPY